MKIQLLGLLLCLSACRTHTTSNPQGFAKNDGVVDSSLCRSSIISNPRHRIEGSTAKIGVKAVSKGRTAPDKPTLSATEKQIQKDQLEVYTNPWKNIRCPDDLAAAETMAEGTPDQEPVSTSLSIAQTPNTESTFVLIPADPKRPALAQTRPIYIPDPVTYLPNGEAGFGCYGACGASCGCAGRIDSTESREEVVNGVKVECHYEIVNCFTHPFCRWHDACYYGCDHSYPTNSFLRSICYRTCDSGCLTGKSPSAIMKEWPDAALDIDIPDAPFSAMRCKHFATNENVDLYEERMIFSRRTLCRPLP